MDDYITVLLDHLSDTRPFAISMEELQEQRALEALESTFTAEQKKLFLAYEDARNGSASVRQDQLARAAFLLARDIFR